MHRAVKINIETRTEGKVLWVPPPDSPTSWPCADCGLRTGNFCDGGPRFNLKDLCYACHWNPRDFAESTQRTPLCSFCETLHKYCRFCRGVAGCTPPARDTRWSGMESGRGFDQAACRVATIAEWFRSESISNNRATESTSGSKTKAVAKR